MAQTSTLVVYSTKHGSTERYAQWIAADCGADLRRAGETKAEDLLRYDTIIYGGCVYQGTLRGADLLKKNLEKLRGKKLAVFAVGLTHPADDAAFAQVLAQNFTPAQQEGIRFFHFPGALDYSKMTFSQKYMMKLLVKNIRKRPADQWSEIENSIVLSYGTGVDFTNRSYIQPLVQYIQSAE